MGSQYMPGDAGTGSFGPGAPPYPIPPAAGRTAGSPVHDFVRRNPDVPAAMVSKQFPGLAESDAQAIIDQVRPLAAARSVSAPGAGQGGPPKRMDNGAAMIAPPPIVAPSRGPGAPPAPQNASPVIAQNPMAQGTPPVPSGWAVALNPALRAMSTPMPGTSGQSSLPGPPVGTAANSGPPPAQPGVPQMPDAGSKAAPKGIPATPDKHGPPPPAHHAHGTPEWLRAVGQFLPLVALAYAARKNPAGVAAGIQGWQNGIAQQQRMQLQQATTAVQTARAAILRERAMSGNTRVGSQAHIDARNRSLAAVTRVLSHVEDGETARKIAETLDPDDEYGFVAGLTDVAGHTKAANPWFGAPDRKRRAVPPPIATAPPQSGVNAPTP